MVINPKFIKNQDGKNVGVFLGGGDGILHTIGVNSLFRALGCQKIMMIEDRPTIMQFPTIQDISKVYLDISHTRNGDYAYLMLGREPQIPLSNQTPANELWEETAREGENIHCYWDDTQALIIVKDIDNVNLLSRLYQEAKAKTLHIKEVYVNNSMGALMVLPISEMNGQITFS